MLQGSVGNGWAGDIAIDDIKFDSLPCVNSSLPQQASTSSKQLICSTVIPNPPIIATVIQNPPIIATVIQNPLSFLVLLLGAVVLTDLCSLFL